MENYSSVLYIRCKILWEALSKDPRANMRSKRGSLAIDGKVICRHVSFAALKTELLLIRSELTIRMANNTIRILAACAFDRSCMELRQAYYGVWYTARCKFLDRDRYQSRGAQTVFIEPKAALKFPHASAMSIFRDVLFRECIPALQRNSCNVFRLDTFLFADANGSIRSRRDKSHTYAKKQWTQSKLYFTLW